MELSVGEMLKTISEAGVIGLLVLVGVGLVKKWWVVGWAYDDVRAERDEWKELALSGTRTTERAVEVVAKRTRAAKKDAEE